MVNKSKEVVYLETLIGREASAVSAKLGDTDALDRQKIVDALSELAARVAVLEAMAIQEGLDIPATAAKLPNTSIKLPLEQTLSVTTFEHSDAIEELVWSKEGRPFAVVASGGELNVLLEVSRQVEQTLAIDVMGSSRGVSLKKTKLFVDTRPTSYRISKVRGQKRLIARLPKASFSGATHVLIQFPKVPRNEYLRLGDVHCVPRLGFVKGLLKRLLGR